MKHQLSNLLFLLGGARVVAFRSWPKGGQILCVAALLAGPVLFAQPKPVCGPSGCPGPNPPPGSGGVQITVDRGQPFNQTGMGTAASAPTQTGGTTTIQGSSSYTYAVPLFDVPGPGLNFKLALYYNSHVWITDGAFLMGFDRNTPAPGFQLNYGFVEWNPSPNGPGGIISTPDGAKHTLSQDLSNLVPNAPPPNNLTYSCANQICLYNTDDSSYINVARPLGTQNGQPCTGTTNCPAKDITVTFKNGTQAIYQSFAVVTNDQQDEFVMRPYQIEDSNGNFMTIAYTNANDLAVSSVTDPVGRTYNFFYTDAASGAVCGGGGACTSGSMLNCVTDGASCSTPNARTFTFSYDSAHAINFNFSPNSAMFLASGNLFTVTSGFTTPVLTQVCRPNGTCVKFNYGDWAIVNDIQEVSANGAVRYELSYDFPAASAGALTSNPTYTHQTEQINGQTNVYTYANNLNAKKVVISSVITDPTGLITTTTFSNKGDWADGLPTQVQTTDSSGKVWSTRAMVWTSDQAEAQSGITNGGFDTGKNPRPSSITSTLEDNSQSQTTFKYDNSTTPIAAGAPTPFSGSGSIIDQVETDFGAGVPGPVLRETVTQYTSFSGHILGLPTDVQVKDGTGKVVSHSVLSYDGAAVQNVSPLPAAGHDNVNYSSSGTASRGNLTGSTTYADPVHNTGGITTTYTYDLRGNKVNQQIGCCTQTAWNFSSMTDYAYPDSVAQGPSGSQLTTSFTYNANGTVATTTDLNGKVTTFNYDVLARSTTTQTPDSVTTRTSYDDQSSNPGVSQSSSANSLVTTHVRDFKGHPVTDEILNGTSLVSSVSYVNDAKGRPLQVSNPYGPSDSPIYTTYLYDPLGRQTQVTPPALAAGTPQTPYKSDITGPTTLFTDPAGQQSKQYRNALGQVVRVDQPGPSGGAVATAPVALTGTEQSVPSNSASNGATAGTANIGLSAVAPCSSSQLDRCVTVLTHSATPASVTVNVGGNEVSNLFTSTFCTGGPPSHLPLNCHTTTAHPADTGTIQFSVNVGGTVVSSSTTYGATSSAAGLAAALAGNFPSNSVASISYASGATSFTITTTATGSATNSSTLSASVSTNCTPSFTNGQNGSSSSTSCNGPGFTISPNQNFTGGTENGFTTYNDTGNVTVSFVVPGPTPTSPTVQVSETVPYAPSDTPITLAQALATKFSADSNALQYVNASASSGQLTLITTATGTGTNYAITLNSVTNSSQFPAGSTSFQLSGPAAFVPGQPGTLFDAGTVTATLNGLDSGTAPTETVNYSQGSTTEALATSLVAKMNADPRWSGAVTASMTSGSSTITLTATSQGAAPNQYSVSIVGTSNFPSSFPTPSFASPADTAQLANGAEPAFSISTPTTTNYTVDPMGHILQVSRGQQTQTFGYDGLGRMTSSATPETAGQPFTFTYTDFGGIQQRTDPRLVPGTNNHITTTYGYDPQNRVSTVTYNDNVTANVSYTYNPPNAANNTGGRLASVSNNVESKAYQYDIMGRIAQCQETIGANQYTIQYAYAADGQLASITYPSQLKVSYAYDSIGRLTQLGTAPQNILGINSGDYNAAGLPVKVSYGNNVTGTFGFNNQLQTVSIQYSAPAPATPLLSLTYNYGGGADNGQIQAITDNVIPSRSTLYLYDPLGRLQNARTVDQTSANTWNLNYEYDVNNNRVRQAAEGGTAAMPVSFTPVDPTTNHIQGLGVIYDAVGNMVSDGLNYAVFDANNNLTSTSPVPGLGGNPVTLAYGPSGELVNKNGTYYIYGNGQPIAEYANGAAATSPSAEYVNLGGQQIARIAGGAATFNYPDHLSTRVTADSSGSTVSTNWHYPYGETAVYTGPASDFVFTSYRRDSSNGLDYADARWYSSRLGRFVSMDPLMGDNRYAYVSGDPINSVDPTGMVMECTNNPFDHRPLPLCAPGMGGAGDSSSSCGISFDDGGGSLDFTSNCNSFNVTFQGPGDPFGGIQSTLQNLLRVVFNPDTCPAGTFECPGDGAPLFGLPSCDPQFCLMDVTNPLSVRAPGQGFLDCLGKNVDNYSLSGIAGIKNPVAKFFLDNDISGLAWGDSADASAALAAHAGLDGVERGMGKTLTYGRRTSDIMNLNLQGIRGGGKGGLAALGKVGAKTVAGKIASFLVGIGEVKTAIDVGLALAEEANCAMPR